MRLAVVTTVHGRRAHLRNLLHGLTRQTRPADAVVVVRMDDDEPVTPMALPVSVLDVAGGRGGLPLAAARNAGHAAAVDAGASALVFLDVDCVPGAGLVDGYARALRAAPDALLCGAVAYLPAGVTGDRPERVLRAAAIPHAARPVATRTSLPIRPELFWGLSFACATATLRRVGGFDASYVGYGGEDTDLGLRAQEAGVAILAVAGAPAYHQHHAVSSPPVEHLAEIVVNAHRFRARWRRWPMEGWLEAFARDGLVHWEPHGDRLELA